MTKRARILASLLLIALIVSCAPGTPEPAKPTAFPVPSVTSKPTEVATITSTPMVLGLYRAPEIPDMLIAESDNWGIPLIADPDQAALHLELVSAGDETTIASRTTWIYALVVPFPTITDRKSVV